MMTLDTVKIKANKKYMLNFKIMFCEEYAKDGMKTGLYYSSKKDASIPFNVFVGVDLIKQTLTLEFSSKILGQDYPKLISKDTIRQCLVNFNKLGLCLIDVDGVLNTGCITAMDVTTDKDMPLTNEVLDALARNVNQYRRYKWNHYEGEGITFQRDVKAKDCKESFTIYNKEKELEKTENRQWLSTLDDQAALLGHFKGKTRFEVKLPTKRKIQATLGLKDTYIADILNCDRNVLLYVFNRIFGHKEEPAITPSGNYEEWAMKIVLRHFNGNTHRIDEELRKVYSDKSRSGRTERMKKLCAVWKKMQSEDIPRDYIDEVRNVLK